MAGTTKWTIRSGQYQITRNQFSVSYDLESTGEGLASCSMIFGADAVRERTRSATRRESGGLRPGVGVSIAVHDGYVYAVGGFDGDQLQIDRARIGNDAGSLLFHPYDPPPLTAPARRILNEYAAISDGTLLVFQTLYGFDGAGGETNYTAIWQRPVDNVSRPWESLVLRVMPARTTVRRLRGI